MLRNNDALKFDTNVILLILYVYLHLNGAKLVLKYASFLRPGTQFHTYFVVYIYTLYKVIQGDSKFILYIHFII